MSAQATRLELFIDVFDQPRQRALTLPTLTSGELLTSILQEFREYDFLSDNPGEYQLIKIEDNSPLESGKAIGEQLQQKAPNLRFVEQEVAAPNGTVRPSQPIYLREQVSGKVYKLHWLPALIGRSDPDAADNERLAVNLDSAQAGLRVSRRHASITEENGQFYVTSLSQNPTSILIDGNTATISRRWPLQNGTVIHLDRSGISFKFIIRQPTVANNDPVANVPGSNIPGSSEPVAGAVTNQ